MLLRPSIDADLDQVLACTVTEPVGWVQPHRYLAGLTTGEHRHEWTWVAECDGRIVARAVWWGPEGASHPVALDCVYVDATVPGRIDLAGRLITAGQQALRAPGHPLPPEYDLNMPNGWRADPVAGRAFGWRRKAAAIAGLTNELERFRYRWIPSAGLPSSGGRLQLREEPDDGVFLDAFRRVAAGSLDVTTQREVAVLGTDRQAREDMALYQRLPGNRTWWRLAYTSGGGLAGLAIPSRGAHGSVVGYLGVVPELRGHGYVNDLLAEVTLFHAKAGAERILASTDTTNLPMAAAFDRAGYRVYGIRMVLSAPPGSSWAGHAP